MKRFRHLLSPYSLTLILPVVIAALLTGGLNLVSFLELQEDHRVARAQQIQDSNEIKLTRNFNKEIASVQDQVVDLLEKAASGQVDEAGGAGRGSEGGMGGWARRLRGVTAACVV